MEQKSFAPSIIEVSEIYFRAYLFSYAPIFN